ncbi:MAG: response regulator, partial [Oscillospiraceae bacterium]
MKILIVDDDLSILKGLSIIIRKFEMAEQCKIYTSDNGLDALELLSSIPIDLVITDLEMPGISGLELVKQAREHSYTGSFIILTAHADFELARQAMRYQVSDYLLKPVDKQELRRLVCQHAASMGLGEKSHPVALPSLPIFDIAAGRENCTEKLGKILEYIDKHFTIDLSLNLLAERFHITSSYICILFQQELHTTFLSYLD